MVSLRGKSKRLGNGKGENERWRKRKLNMGIRYG